MIIYDHIWTGPGIKLATVPSHDTSGHRDIMPRPADRRQNWPWPVDNHHPFGGSKYIYIERERDMCIYTYIHPFGCTTNIDIHVLKIV